MTDRFVHGLWQHVFFWSGWLFTIAGTVAAISIGWVGSLIALVGIASAVGFAWEKHREQQQARQETERIRKLLEEAERKINEMPLEALLRIEEIVSIGSTRAAFDELVRHADYVSRMAKFWTSVLNLRTFVNEAGGLYAVARAEKAVISLLKVGDPFILTKKNSAGLVTDSARLTVHQREEKNDSVWFRVHSYLGDEMPHLEALAAKKDVAGLTGYSLRPVCRVEDYAIFQFSNMKDLIRTLADEIMETKGWNND